MQSSRSRSFSSNNGNFYENDLDNHKLNPSYIRHFNQVNERLDNISINDKLNEIIRKNKETKDEIAEIKKLLQDVLNQPGYLSSISSYAQYPFSAVFGSNQTKRGGRKTRRKRK